MERLELTVAACEGSELDAQDIGSCKVPPLHDPNSRGILPAYLKTSACSSQLSPSLPLPLKLLQRAMALLSAMPVHAQGSPSPQQPPQHSTRTPTQTSPLKDVLCTQQPSQMPFQAPTALGVQLQRSLAGGALHEGRCCCTHFTQGHLLL